MNTSRTVSKRKSNWIFQCFCLVLGVLILFPVLYALSVSLLQPEDILSSPPKLLPSYLYLQNYADALRLTDLLRFIVNSLVISVTASFFRILFGSMAAYAFAYYSFRGKKLLFFLVLGTMMIHPDTVIVTNYMTVSRLGLVNTYSGIVIVFLISAMNIFMLRQYFLTVSREIREAALVDGISNLGFFCRILIPLSKPVLAVVFISSFINMWNQYMWPLLVTNRNEMRPVQVGITLLNFAEGAMYGPTMAATIMVLLPTMLIFLLFRRHMVEDISAGALKA